MWKAILTTALLAGTLDILAAFGSAFLRSGVSPERVLRFVASGVFGREAFVAGSAMLAWGLLFHYIIAFACTAGFFLLYRSWRRLVSNPWLNALVLGIATWIATELIILPLSNVPARPLTFSGVAISLSLLTAFIGLPIAWRAHNFFKSPPIHPVRDQINPRKSV